jgi:hypothetical protein
MVDLEDAKIWKRIAVREGIETGTEQDVLGHAARDGLGQQVFRVTATRDEEGSKGNRERLAELCCGAFDLGQVFTAKDGNGDGIVEDERLRIVKLMCGSPHGDTEGGAGWAGGFHG